MDGEVALQRALADLVPTAFLEWQAIPGTALEGFLLNADSASKPLDHDVTRQVMEAPPFWSLLWPAGFLLCRLLAEFPELVLDRHCVDLGCGSGLLSAAVVKAGGRVVAADTDPLSRSVTHLHVGRQGLSASVVDHWEGVAETLFLADFLYDEDNLTGLVALLPRVEEVVVVDCRLESLQVEGFQYLGLREEQAYPDLDPHREFGTVRIWYKGPRLDLWRGRLQGLESPFAG